MKESTRTWILAAIIFGLCLYGTICNGQTVDQVRTFIEDSTTIQHADIVLKQSIEETGHFKCTSCSMDRNNLFGFWYKGKFLSFDSWQASVRYYEAWQKRHYKGGDYYEFLKRVGFATNPAYIDNLKRIKV